MPDDIGMAPTNGAERNDRLLGDLERQVRFFEHYLSIDQRYRLQTEMMARVDKLEAGLKGVEEQLGHCIDAIDRLLAALTPRRPPPSDPAAPPAPPPAGPNVVRLKPKRGRPRKS